MSAALRVVVADDERPARTFLVGLLRSFPDVRVVGEAESGPQAVVRIEREKPDLALLDWHMPELDGIGLVRMLRKEAVPLVAFVTAHDAYAVKAFEVNAVDYLLKPVDRARLRDTVTRAQQRLGHADVLAEQAARLDAALEAYEASRRLPYLQRIPVRHRDEVRIVPVQHIACIVADGELLGITTIANERYVINHRLKDLEQRLDPGQFLRLGRGTLANVDLITRVTAMPGGTHVVVLNTGHELSVSRSQSRVLRDRLLKL